MGFFSLILLALVAASTTFFGTKYLNENYPFSSAKPTAETATPTTSTSLSPTSTIYVINTPHLESTISVTLEPTITMIPDPTIPPTSTPKPTPKPTLTKTPTPKPTITPTFTPSVAVGEVGPTATPTPNLGSNIYDLTSSYASQYGIDPNVLRYIIQCESGFNPAATSPNGLYAGLFQFSSGTWTTYRNLLDKNPDPALRYTAEDAIQTGAFAYSLTHGSIWPNCLP